MNINDIRREFVNKLNNKDFVTDKTGVKTIELVGTSLIIDPLVDDHIFGEPNLDYADRELQWYESQSLYVKDIPGKTPAIWEQVASKNDGRINSNYGFLIYSWENFNQYANVYEALENDPNSRRAIAIYTRPRMHYDFNKNGMSDFICTNTVQYLIRDGKLISIVNMRSNDAIFGFRNDLHWQKHVQTKLATDLGIDVGSIFWQVGSFHIYERHFYLVDYFKCSGKTSVKKADYFDLYGSYY